MRIPDNASYMSFLNDLQRTQAQVLDAQMKVTSGKKIQKPSDDPSGAADIVRLSGEKAADDQFGKNLNTAKSRLAAADIALDGVETLVERARQLGLSALGDLSNAAAYKTEIEGIREQLISSANTTQGGRYIFGGSVTSTAPFAQQSDSTVTYAGNSNVMTLQVGRNSTMQTQIPGDEIFAGSNDVFATLDGLLAGMNAGSQDDVAAQVKKLELMSEKVSAARSRIGGYINVAESMSSQLGTAELSRNRELNDVQSADMAQAITQLTLSQTSLDATLAVGARIKQQSLLDYL
jgi:flagellar hook-associated protein 3 FlgL